MFIYKSQWLVIVTIVFLKVSRLIASMLSIFRLFQSIIALGKKEYLYKSSLGCSCVNLREFSAWVYDTGDGWSKQRFGNTSKFLTILNSKISLAFLLLLFRLGHLRYFNMVCCWLDLCHGLLRANLPAWCWIISNLQTVVWWYGSQMAEQYSIEGSNNCLYKFSLICIWALYKFLFINPRRQFALPQI